MKQHKAYCVSPGTARRIMALGSLAIGFPLLNGKWSIEDGPFTVGEKIEVIFTARKQTKVYGRAVATVKDETRPSDDGFALGGRSGCFRAVFDPIAWPAATKKA